jgi:hypothetical protein
MPDGRPRSSWNHDPTAQNGRSLWRPQWGAPIIPLDCRQTLVLQNPENIRKSHGLCCRGNATDYWIRWLYISEQSKSDPLVQEKGCTISFTYACCLCDTSGDATDILEYQRRCGTESLAYGGAGGSLIDSDVHQRC